MAEELINIRLGDDGRSVVIIDQTLLPGELKYLTLSAEEEFFEAICNLRVRGAPAIGIFAAYALYVLGVYEAERGSSGDNVRHFTSKMTEYSAYLRSSRPTAVNLETSLRRMTDAVNECAGNGCTVSQILEIMRSEAESVHNEDIAMCRAIAEYGVSLIRENYREGFGIMTQCNAGPLATSKYGTGLGPIILGHKQGLNLCAFVCETRPLLQGARLTAYELMNLGIDCTLICDNMASTVMSEGKVDAVFTGCDRIAANGDVANKVGTSGLAVLARHYGIPFYVFGPSTTIDMNCPTGADIIIEQRASEEITDMFFKTPAAPAGVKCYNPAFDITPRGLITAIITENGKF